MRLLATLILLQMPLYCCTDFQITAEDKTEVVGRSMEFATPFHSEVILHPQGEKYTTLLTNQTSTPPQTTDCSQPTCCSRTTRGDELDL